MSNNILVACCTGALGKLIVEALITQNVPANQIFGLVRDPKKPVAVEFASKSITIRTGDFTDYKSLLAAFDGIQTLMFISTGSFDKRSLQYNNVIKAAKECGSIKNIVYTSVLKCLKDSKFLATPDHVVTEELLKKSGIPYTIFRNTFYADLLPEMLGDALTSGKWGYPVKMDTKVNFVSRAEIGEGLANVLRNLTPHVNKIYEITSGKSYTFTEIATIIGKSCGKNIVFNTITLDVWKAGLKSVGVPEVEINFYGSSTEMMVAGELDFVDTGLEKILGRKLKSLEEFLPTIFDKK